MDGADVDPISGTGRDAVDNSFRILVSRLGALDDPRQAGKVTYPLVEMSVVVGAGVIADCDGWEDVADFGRDRLDWIRQFLPFENGVPPHDTFARVFSVVDVVLTIVKANASRNKARLRRFIWSCRSADMTRPSVNS